MLLSLPLLSFKQGVSMTLIFLWKLIPILNLSVSDSALLETLNTYLFNNKFPKADLP